MRCALVFANIPFHDEVFVSDFMRFVKRLKWETQLHQIIILEPKEAKHAII